MRIEFKAKPVEQYDWTTGSPVLREGYKVPAITSSHSRTANADLTTREKLALSSTSKTNKGLGLPAYVFPDTQGVTITPGKGMLATITVDTAAL